MYVFVLNVAASRDVLWAGNAGAWVSPRHLTVSRDGGVTWTQALNSSGGDIIFGGLDASYGLPGAPSIGFASDWRTEDAGVTWARMVGCTSVLAHDASPARRAASAAPPKLYGVDQSSFSITTSADGGVTWDVLFPAPGKDKLSDLAYDWSSNTMYVVSDNALWSCRVFGGGSWSCVPVDLPADQYGNNYVRTVAVDPVEPSVVYAGHAADMYAASNSVVQSTSAGAPGSWVVLLLDTPLSTSPDAALQGPHEVTCVRVHPSTRALWAAGSCFGVWTAPPPT